jgi:hypothetical protein
MAGIRKCRHCNSTNPAPRQRGNGRTARKPSAEATTFQTTKGTRAEGACGTRGKVRRAENETARNRFIRRAISLRPPHPLTFGRLQPPGEASIYHVRTRRKRHTRGDWGSASKSKTRAFCGLFIYQHFPAIRATCGEPRLCPQARRRSGGSKCPRSQPQAVVTGLHAARTLGKVAESACTGLGKPALDSFCLRLT